MSRCPYCDRELTGLETLCKQCFEAGYDRVAHPAPWWKPLHQLRLGLNSVYGLLFTFGFCFLDFRFFLHHTTKGAALAAFATALLVAVLESISGDDKQALKQKKGAGITRRP